jgi:hypothetical protein
MGSEVPPTERISMHPSAPTRTKGRGRLNLAVTLLTCVIVVAATVAQGAGSSLPTRAVTLPSGATAYWLVHDSPTTQVVNGGTQGNERRVIRWGSGGLYAETRRTYAVFGFRLLSGSPGRMYDFHTQPQDVGGWEPPCSHRVAPLAIDYWGDSRGLHVTAQPEDTGCNGTPPPGYVAGSGNFHFRILSQAEAEARRGQWVWLWAEITWGRRDLATKGGVKVWLVGESSPRVEVSGINTHWPQQNQITFWEGAYHSSGSSGTNSVEIAATRFGRSPQEAQQDAPVLFAAGPAGNPGGSSTAVAPAGSADASMPAALGGAPQPTAPPPPPVAPPPPPPPTPALLKLDVRKVVVGASVSPTAFTFAVSNGGGTHAFEADGVNRVELSAGTYTVTEPPVSGWTTTYSSCSNVSLATPQATVPTCTITNTRQAQPSPPPPPPPPPPPDTTAPSAPAELTVTNATPTRLSIAWKAATDNVGVTRYGVHRDGELVSLLATRTTTLGDLQCGTSYTVAVDARDAAGNESAKTTLVTSTDPCAPDVATTPTTPAPTAPAAPNQPAAPTNQPAAPTTGKPQAPASDRPRPEKADDRNERTEKDRIARGLRAWKELVRTTRGPDRRPRHSSSSLLSSRSLLSGWLWTVGLAESFPELGWSALLVTPSAHVQRRDTDRETEAASSGPDRDSVRWDGRRFFSRNALKLHLDWSGRDFRTWVRQHPGALTRLDR